MIERKGVAAFLHSHSAANPVSFHMPGHKGSDIYRRLGYGEFLDNIADWDITEIPGADNLFQAEGIIKETMEKYTALYESRAGYMLINGSSAGLIAAIMSSVPSGGTLIAARNCHKSIFNGIALGDIRPVYAYPEIIEDYGITGEVTVGEICRCIDMYPEAAAVILPSPNYYGICSDIEAIAEAVHRRDKTLIVDQAHGAHLKFFDRYIGDRIMAAENLGADIVINSTHKTLASFTQSAVANICTGRVDRDLFEDKLQAIESTSPSYLMMASLDINADLLIEHGEELITEWDRNIKSFYEEASEIKGLKVIKHPRLDSTKINLDMSALGIDGLSLEKLLMEQGIFVELVTGSIAMCMSGIGNTPDDFDKLLTALRKIADGKASSDDNSRAAVKLPSGNLTQRDVPSQKEKVLLQDSIGRVCALSIIPYPPGIPMVCPGEVIDEETAAYVTELRRAGEKVMGVDEEGRVVVGKKG